MRYRVKQVGSSTFLKKQQNLAALQVEQPENSTTDMPFDMAEHAEIRQESPKSNVLSDFEE